MRQTQAAEASLAATVRERDALLGKSRANEARANQAEVRARELEARNVALQQTVERSRTTVTSVTTNQPNVADDPLAAPMKAKIAQAAADKQALNQLRSTNTEFQRAMLEAERIGLGVRYAPLYKNLNLSPEQVAKFEQRMAESMQHEVDIVAAAHAKGMSPADPALAKLGAQAKAEMEADLKAILGEAGLREFQFFDRTFGAREMVNGLSGNLVYVGAPLSIQQMNQLTQLLAEHSPNYQRGARVPGRAQDVVWDGLVEQAAAFLSPPQLDTLRAMSEQARAAKRAQELTEPMMRKLSPLQPGMAPQNPAPGKPSGGS
jgi:hypothetical protein